VIRVPAFSHGEISLGQCWYSAMDHHGKETPQPCGCKGRNRSDRRSELITLIRQ